MMTRVNSQFEETHTRWLQASQWGILCPADTPFKGGGFWTCEESSIIGSYCN